MPMKLEEQRRAVMARHKELLAIREAIDKEIDENLRFFAGKEAQVKSGRGSIDVEVIKVYRDGMMRVRNLDSGKDSTRVFAELIGMLDPDQEDDSNG